MFRPAGMLLLCAPLAVIVRADYQAPARRAAARVLGRCRPRSPGGSDFLDILIRRLRLHES